ncbi:MAG: hypothetical protein F4Z07_09575 [Dehalococcoidia bacterium]|nr:hypothetical protein [Dehalococcoidia bacterium]
MSADRSGWGSPGPTKIVALAALTALVVGISLVTARGDPAGPGQDAPAPQLETVADARGGNEAEPASAPAAPDVSESTTARVVPTDEDGVEDPGDSPPPPVVTEPAEVSIASGPRLVTEAAPALFTLTRTGETGRALTVAVGVAESGSMLDGAAPEAVTFAEGERTTTLSVAMVDDDVVEATSRVAVTISPGEGYLVQEDAGSAAVFVADNDRHFLLPDLVSDAPTPWGEAEVVWWSGEEMLVLRFEGYVTNLGDGPLDLRGNPQLADPDDATSHEVWQRVRTSTGDWVSLTKPPVRYETADGHNHFHLMKVMEYSLWDETGTTQVAPGRKVGFCMLDVEPLPERHPAPGERGYEEEDIENCRANQPDTDYLLMGVTEGWRDVYEGNLTFQWVDVSDLSPGHYRLAARADPHDIVVESDETNNGVAISDVISVVPGHVAQPLAVATESDTAIDIVLAAETFGIPGSRYFRVVTAPANGTLNAAVGDWLSGTILWYTPDAGFSGYDLFEYEAFDPYSAYPRQAVRAVVAIRVGEADAPLGKPNDKGDGVR